MPTGLAAACGLLAPLTCSAALLFGGLAQPDAFSSADDAISDLGAETASSAWIYNQIGLNLTGMLVVAIALGLWRALSPDLLGRLGAAEVLHLQDVCERSGVGVEPTYRWATPVSPVLKLCYERSI